MIVATLSGQLKVGQDMLYSLKTIHNVNYCL